MQLIKVVGATLAILAVLLILAIYGGSRWISNNKEEIAKEVGTTIGIGREEQRECRRLETRYQTEWDAAVDNGTIARREADFSAMREEIDQLCKPK
jgi:Tfp pilus assembly protein FimT